MGLSEGFIITIYEQIKNCISLSCLINNAMIFSPVVIVYEGRI